MTNRPPVKTSVQVKALQVRLFKAAAEMDQGDVIVFDSQGPTNPYENMYDRHGVSRKRPRR